MEQESKPVFKSKTLLGVFIAAVPDILQHLIPLAESGVLSPQVAAAVRVAGLLFAAYGRITASRSLT